MIKETKTIEIFCDICHKKCTKENKKRKFFLTDNNYLKIRLSCFIDYGVSDGDLCNECALNLMTRFIEDLKFDVINDAKNEINNT